MTYFKIYLVCLIVFIQPVIVLGVLLPLYNLNLLPIVKTMGLMQKHVQFCILQDS